MGPISGQCYACGLDISSELLKWKLGRRRELEQGYFCSTTQGRAIQIAWFVICMWIFLIVYGRFSMKEPNGLRGILQTILPLAACGGIIYLGQLICKMVAAWKFDRKHQDLISRSR
jgi:hypothetical protein